MMQTAFLVRKWHKWLGLIVGIQAVLWLISGVYMVTVDLDYIHGDHMVRKMDEPLTVDYSEVLPLSKIQQDYPGSREIQLVSWIGEPFYRVYGVNGTWLVDARSGEVRSPITEEDVRRTAEYHFAPEGNIRSIILFEEGGEKPSEIQARPLPLWQVRFDDATDSRFYINPHDGRVITRRHTFWRAFDFMWMLHIMDYEERADFNNNLLRVASILGTLLAAAGFWLLFYSFGTRRKTSEGEEA